MAGKWFNQAVRLGVSTDLSLEAAKPGAAIS